MKMASLYEFLCPCLPKALKVKDDDADGIEAHYDDTFVNGDRAILSSKIVSIDGKYDAYIRRPEGGTSKDDDLVLVPTLHPGDNTDYMEICMAGEDTAPEQASNYLYFRDDIESED